LEFRSVPSTVLTAEVDLVPTGLGQTGDAQARLQRGQALLTILSQHPLTAQNWKLQAKLIETLLRDSREPAADTLMELIYADLAAKEQAAQQQAQLQQFALLAQTAEQQAAGEAEREQQGAEEGRTAERHRLELAERQQAMQQAALQPPAGGGGA
jgi:hypothetical protein